MTQSKGLPYTVGLRQILEGKQIMKKHAAMKEYNVHDLRILLELNPEQRQALSEMNPEQQLQALKDPSLAHLSSGITSKVCYLEIVVPNLPNTTSWISSA